ncbi:hydroxyethylthiazole kinase [Rothia kristinae]|uniref:hydroxyethylthiazole kinase n=1 Tax=Rothia kristinae TaxID=37923 RepID=UPI0007E61AE7|nr:hydroxyethylthiazole kinase [Rothia kristinae]
MTHFTTSGDSRESRNLPNSQAPDAASHRGPDTPGSAPAGEASASDLPARVAVAVDAVRARGSLVHAMTNSVVREISADVLLAVGASPAMVDHPEEAGVFAGLADGVLVNVGNPSDENLRAYRRGIAGARDHGVPWVLDPVAVGVLEPRTGFAREVLELSPAAIRGNASEVSALAGRGAGGRGVDATDTVESALEAARALAERTGAVVAVSGERDLIVSAHRVTRLVSGHPLMPLVIGTGCALGAVVAAYLGAVREVTGTGGGQAKSASDGQDAGSSPEVGPEMGAGPRSEAGSSAGTGSSQGSQSPDAAAPGRETPVRLDAHDAVLAAHAHLGAAGILAGREARGPGSFRVAWLDALHALDGAGVVELVGMEELA